MAEPLPLARPASPGVLFTAFTALALKGYGGVLPVAQRTLVDDKRWMSREQFLELLSISQVLPGPNIINMALIFGDRCHGWRGAQKRIEPALLGGALAGWPGTLVSVQREPRAADAAAFASACGREPVDASSANDDIGELLAVLSLVDELAGVSSTSMHLRAAAGGTAHVLVPYPAEWRWLARGAESPWFPGYSIHRQRADMDWTEALAGLRRGLRL